MKSKVKWGLYFFLLVAFVFTTPVYAYIDPATTTYVIQIVTAIVITLSVTIGVFFTKLRLSLLTYYARFSGFMIRLFSGNKEKKPSVQTRIPPETDRYPSSGESHSQRFGQSFRERLFLSASVGGAFSFTFVLFGIYEIFILNIHSFIFPFKLIFWPVVLTSLVIFFILSGLCLLLRGRFFDNSISLLFGVVLAGYVQGNFLNRGLGALTGDQIDWSARSGSFVINTIIWIAIMAIPLILMRKKRKAWSFTVKALSGLLIVVQSISMIALRKPSFVPLSQQDKYLSTQGIYEVSDQRNIIVIVLDRLDNRYIQCVKEDDPHFFDRLDGFTQFTDNMSLYSQTFPSVANMFSGRLHLFERPQSEYLRDVWSNSAFLPRLRDDRFAVRLYMEQGYTFDKASDLAKIAENIAESQIKIHRIPAIGQFLRLTAFRYAPLGAKPFFWTSTDRFSQLVSMEAVSSQPPYITNDLYFYEQLKEQKLRRGTQEKQFIYLHLQGPHAPYVMNERAEPVPSEKSGSTIQTKGSFHIVYEYLDQLKRLGLYKNSTIVITGDHGSRRDDINPLESAIVTGLFVKPAGRAGEPLAFNSAPVSSDNLRPFIYEQAGLPYASLGKTYFEVPQNAENARYLYHRLKKTDKNPSRLLIYEIKGDANRFENWTLIEDRVIEY